MEPFRISSNLSPHSNLLSHAYLQCSGNETGNSKGCTNFNAKLRWFSGPNPSGNNMGLLYEQADFQQRYAVLPRYTNAFLKVETPVAVTVLPTGFHHCTPAFLTNELQV